MRRAKIKLFKKTNPEELVAEISGLGKTVAEAERHATEVLNRMERGLESNRKRNKARSKPKRRRQTATRRPARKKALRRNPRKRKVLNFGERMKRLRAKKARVRRR